MPGFATLAAVSNWAERSNMIIVFKLLAYVFLGLLLVYAVYRVYQLYLINLRRRPVLLTVPIRGADYFLEGRRRKYPIVDRTDGDGIPLPYANDELVWRRNPPPEMPSLNKRVQFTIAFWTKIDNITTQYDTQKYSSLLTMGRREEFEISYNSFSNMLRLRVATKDPKRRDLVYSTPNVFKLQRWQLVTIVVDNRIINVYLDRKLISSHLMTNVPIFRRGGVPSDVDYASNNNKWHLFRGDIPYPGIVSCVRFFDYPFNRHDVNRYHSATSGGGEAPVYPFFTWWTWYRGNAVSDLIY